MSFTIHVGDALTVLRTLPAASVQACVTSPPYWGLRDYGVEGQMGLEETPDAYVAGMVAVFAEVRRVLRDDGTLWLNLGDSYAGAAGGGQGLNGARAGRHTEATPAKGGAGLKAKDLCGIPWLVAFALRADGWYLRSDIIWHKPNPMPESITDRPTKAHEYLFLLAKSERYVYDAKAIAEPLSPASAERYAYAFGGAKGEALVEANEDGIGRRTTPIGMREATATRNRRTVWTVTTKPFHGAHFATMPLDLAEPCVLAGAPIGATVLDPFNGAGTTGVAAVTHHRHYIGIELNPEYATMARHRISEADPIGRQGDLLDVLGDSAASCSRTEQHEDPAKPGVRGNP